MYPSAFVAHGLRSWGRQSAVSGRCYVPSHVRSRATAAAAGPPPGRTGRPPLRRRPRPRRPRPCRGGPPRLGRAAGCGGRRRHRRHVLRVRGRFGALRRVGGHGGDHRLQRRRGPGTGDRPARLARLHPPVAGRRRGEDPGASHGDRGRDPRVLRDRRGAGRAPCGAGIPGTLPGRAGGQTACRAAAYGTGLRPAQRGRGVRLRPAGSGRSPAVGASARGGPRRPSPAWSGRRADCRRRRTAWPPCARH